jgi:hypothetical protein
MAEPKRKPIQQDSDLGLGGFDSFFEADQDQSSTAGSGATSHGESHLNVRLDKLIGKFGELITLTVDQRVETARITQQLIENQRQLVATQQILIRLMEKHIELTRHITTIEEKLPAVFELPGMVEQLRARIALLEGIEVD